MCCGQPANRLDDAAARALYIRYKLGADKRILCAVFRIGTPEFDRIIANGQLNEWQHARQLVIESSAP